MQQNLPCSARYLLELLSKTAHALKGGSSSVGALQMAGIAQQLEVLAKSSSMAGGVALIEQIEAEFKRVKAAIAELEIPTAPPSL
jgi:HPt (histidine-containing phosphotransfer) domain-containing protein